MHLLFFFNMYIANVMPGAGIDVELKYAELFVGKIFLCRDRQLI